MTEESSSGSVEIFFNYLNAFQEGSLKKAYLLYELLF